MFDLLVASTFMMFLSFGGIEMAYTIKQLAHLSGVSTRTLRFYDETGLLKPAYVGENQYRYYEEGQLLLLQQILFYRISVFQSLRKRNTRGGDDTHTIWFYETLTQRSVGIGKSTAAIALSKELDLFRVSITLN